MLAAGMELRWKSVADGDQRQGGTMGSEISEAGRRV